MGLLGNLGGPLTSFLGGGQKGPKPDHKPYEFAPEKIFEDFDTGKDHVDGITGNAAAMKVNRNNPVAPPDGQPEWKL